MIPRQKTRALLIVWLLAIVGCAELPPRGERQAGAGLRPGPMDLNPSRSAGSAETTSSRSAAPGQNETEKSPGSPPMPPDQAAREGGEIVEPIAEMSAFIQELEAAPHVDAQTRSEILSTALRTPPELQKRLIGQYRTLLALGRPSEGGKGPAEEPPETVSPVAPLPEEPPDPPQPEGVVAASHREPIRGNDNASASAAKKESESGLEFQLAALLREMRKTKGEAAAPKAIEESPDEGKNVSNEGNGTDGGTLPADATWEELVDAAIEKLEAQKERIANSDLHEEDEARLRLLYLIADRRDDAVRAIASLEPEMQEFWSKQFFGLATLLNEDLIADRSNRLIESKRNLDEALRRLGESAPLFVRNLAFVTEVQSYGAYTPFDDYEFRAGEPVLLYAEVENYRCKETARGYHTSLRSSYEIFDSRRRKVAEHEFSTNEEYCKNPRRDFFTVCEFRMPERLHPGKYELRLTVADLNGDKSGESTITFHIQDES